GDQDLAHANGRRITRPVVSRADRSPDATPSHSDGACDATAAILCAAFGARALRAARCESRYRTYRPLLLLLDSRQVYLASLKPRDAIDKIFPQPVRRSLRNTTEPASATPGAIFARRLEVRLSSL